jgi:molybdate transport system substrate-binding protein
MSRGKWLVFLVLLVFACATVIIPQWIHPPSATAQAGSQLVVSAATSLTDALKELAPVYQKSHSQVTLRYNFASSGALQQQIINGAPIDVFIAAATEPIDQLEQKKLLLEHTRRNLLSNRLVLIVPAQNSAQLNLKGLTANSIKRIAIGDPRTVPAGEYAEAALKQVGLWQPLKPKLVLANNVRQVMQFVEAGNADAGFVYLTDAKTTDKVKITQTLPANLHPPIVYPMAVLKNSRNPKAGRAFAQFLSGSAAKQVFSKYGFKLV